MIRLECRSCSAFCPDPVESPVHCLIQIYFFSRQAAKIAKVNTESIQQNMTEKLWTETWQMR
jgi:Pyruvate/2-oxoacid:ferredoxin oxidoreductase delta subunit